MHIEVSLWNKCNNNCQMCTNPDDFRNDKDYNFDLIKNYLNKKVNKKNRKNIKEIYLTGGEPTIHPNFFKILDYLKNKFPFARFNILSNGRLFFYPEFVKKCIAIGQVNFIIPIHGHDKKTHDMVTRINGSFIQTIQGVKNIFDLRKTGQEVEIRVIITKLTYEELDKILKFLLKEMPLIDRVILIFMEYEGQAIKNQKQIGIRYKEFKPKFKELNKYINKFKEIRFYHFPLCVIPKEFWPYAWRTLREDEVTFLKKCESCQLKNNCLGIHKNYLKLFKEKEFKPIARNYRFKFDDNYYHPISSIE